MTNTYTPPQHEVFPTEAWKQKADWIFYVLSMCYGMFEHELYDFLLDSLEGMEVPRHASTTDILNALGIQMDYHLADGQRFFPVFTGRRIPSYTHGIGYREFPKPKTMDTQAVSDDEEEDDIPF